MSNTAFWNVNVDEADQTAECPSYLKYCFDNAKDRAIINTPDHECRLMSWSDVVYAADHPDLFGRVPSELRKYRQFCEKIEKEHGSILEFILRERLKWEGVSSTSNDFQGSENYKILYNDWPYAINKAIIHLVVWTKFDMPEIPNTDRLFPEMQRKIDQFVEETFKNCCNNFVWFRNWTSLKSVHAVEHFHVMLLEPDMAEIARLTNCDKPLAVKLGYISR